MSWFLYYCYQINVRVYLLSKCCSRILVCIHRFTTYRNYTLIYIRFRFIRIGVGDGLYGTLVVIGCHGNRVSSPRLRYRGCLAATIPYRRNRTASISCRLSETTLHSRETRSLRLATFEVRRLVLVVRGHGRW